MGDYARHIKVKAQLGTVLCEEKHHSREHSRPLCHQRSDSNALNIHACKEHQS